MKAIPENRLNPKVITEIRSLYASKVPLREIASRLGIGKATVSRYLYPICVENQLRRRRLSQLNTKGRVIRGLNKRPYPKSCELCNRGDDVSLCWHHWDDSNLNKGLWLCRPCNSGAELIEKGLVTKYLQLKEIEELRGVKED